MASSTLFTTVPASSPASSLDAPRIRVVDVFNTDRAAKALGMRRAERINQSARYENLIVCADGPYVQMLRDRGIRVLTTPIPRRIAPLAMLRCARRMAAMLRAEGCTIIHSHGSTAAVCARMAARKAGIHLVVHTVHGFHFHSGMHPLRQRIYATAERLLTRYTDLLLFQNQEDLDESVQFGIRAKYGSVKVGNGINLRAFDDLRRAQPGDPPIVLMIGRFEPVKNHVMLLQAATRLVERGVKFQLWFAGGGPLFEQHRQLAQSLGLGDHVKFFGYVTDVVDLVRQASIAVLPSIKEGIPRGLLEPMAAGVPVIATDVKGNRETVVNGETGLLIPLGESQALAMSIERLLKDHSLRDRMGGAASRWVRSQFDEDQVVDRLLNIYDSLVDRAKPVVTAG